MKIYIIKNWQCNVNQNEPKGNWATNLVERMFDTIKIKKDERGKPYIVNGYNYINWGHTDCYLVIAFSEVGPIGVDVENLIIPYDESLYGWILHEEEKYKLKNGTLFSEIWTRKEAILKFTGEGINDNMCDLNSYSLEYNVMSFTFNDIAISVCGACRSEGYGIVYESN